MTRSRLISAVSTESKEAVDAVTYCASADAVDSNGVRITKKPRSTVVLSSVKNPWQWHVIDVERSPQRQPSIHRDLFNKIRRKHFTHGEHDSATFVKVGRVSTKGSIVILSPLTAANGFVRPWPLCTNVFLNPREAAPERHLDRFSHFSVHRSNAFQCSKQLQKVGPTPWRSGPSSYSLGPPKRHLDRFQPFLLTHVANTQTHRWHTGLSTSKGWKAVWSRMACE